jgi:hypothetical protein
VPPTRQHSAEEDLLPMVEALEETGHCEWWQKVQERPWKVY